MHCRTRPITGIVAIASGALVGPVAQAGSDDLEQRVEQLEQRLGASDAAPREAFAWSGTIEIEAFRGEDFAGNETSDIELATLELEGEARVNRHVSAHALLLFEEGTEDDLEVDEAAITVSRPDSPRAAVFGRMYVPFGAFETTLISDPLPLELGETRETAALIRYSGDAVQGSAYAFRGDTSDGGDDNVETFGLQAGWRGDAGGVRYTVGAGYMSSLGDSDAISLARVDDRVGAVDVFAGARRGSFTVTAEYLAAKDAFRANELAFDGEGAQPAAFQLELAYKWSVRHLPVTVSAGVQGTSEALALGLPERRALAGLSVEPWTDTNVSIEWARDRDYARADGGTGEEVDTLTLQLAAGF